MFDICNKNDWKFIIKLKDGNLKSFQTEVSLLRATASKKSVCRTNKTTKTNLEYTFLNDLEYTGRYFSWVECMETIANIKGMVLSMGYALEHKFSRKSFIARQNSYLLMQIAHMINQLVELSNQIVEILQEHSKHTIVDLWKKMRAYLTIFQCE